MKIESVSDENVTDSPNVEKENVEQIELLRAPDIHDGVENSVSDETSSTKRRVKVFEAFKIKDIVFLAIMSACMLIGGAIMPLAIHIPVFGIIHLMLGLQMSLIPVIGLLKVRKVGSLLLMCSFFSVFIVFIQPIMAGGVLLCALLTEVLTVLIFRGYKRESGCVFAATIFFPMSLPLLSLYYRFLFSGEAGEAVGAMVNPEIGVAIGISIAVVALCFLGAIIGAIISRELKRAGAMKK